MKKNKKSLLIMILISLALTGLIHLYIVIFLPIAPNGEWKEVVIKKGMNFRDMTVLLEKEGIVSERQVFKLLGKAYGITKKVRAGYYSLSSSMTMLEVLNALRAGKIIEYSLTIPEGMIIEDIAESLEKTGLVYEQNFIAIATDRSFTRSIGIDANSLEGYLFPDTYLLPKGINPQEIAERMVSRFREVITPQMENRAKEIGFTMHQVITLASIIEREAQADYERELVSAVYHNRLKKRMLLQADPTAIYGIKRLNEKITRKDLQNKSPYNTYRIHGLPPGPIANPGLKSIRAALYPADVDFIFFVSRNDGTHYFSKTASEHNQAVFEYRRERMKRE